MRKISQRQSINGVNAILIKVMNTSVAPAITIAQLEASYPAYCKALRMLVQDGISLAKVQRTV